MSVVGRPGYRVTGTQAPVRRGGRPLRAVVRRGLVDNRRAPLSWGLPLGAMCALIVGMYPSIEDSLDELMKNYPQSLKDAFGIKDLNTVEAYLDAEMFSLIVPLAIAFFAVRSMTRAISVAEERGYLDTALAAPLSRRALVAGSFAATALASATVLFAVFVLTVVVGVAAGTGLSLVKAVEGVANVWPLAVFFAGVAVLVAGFLHRSAPVTAISTGTLVGMYVVDLVGKMADPVEPLRVVTVFKYYGSGLTEGIDPAAFTGLTLCGAALALAGTLLFERRDVLA
jgi:ABC-2 type transport system permease protein